MAEQSLIRNLPDGTIVDLLASDEGADIEFEPGRLGFTARHPDL